MVDLGIPSAPPAPLHPRRKTNQLQVGSVGVGSDSPVSVQSMCTTLTADVNSTLQQIELTFVDQTSLVSKHFQILAY